MPFHCTSPDSLYFILIQYNVNLNFYLNRIDFYAKRQEKAAACNFLSIKTHIKLFYCDLPIFRRFYRLSVFLMCKAP